MTNPFYFKVFHLSQKENKDEQSVLQQWHTYTLEKEPEILHILQLILLVFDPDSALEQNVEHLNIFEF